MKKIILLSFLFVLLASAAVKAGNKGYIYIREGVKIEDQTNPELQYAYWSDDAVLKLSPENRFAKEMGTLQFSTMTGVLTGRVRLKLGCAKR